MDDRHGANSGGTLACRDRPRVCPDSHDNSAYLLHDISPPIGRVDRHEVSPYIRPYRVKGEVKRMTPNSHIWAGRT